jgi:hypothetical protein
MGDCGRCGRCGVSLLVEVRDGCGNGGGCGSAHGERERQVLCHVCYWRFPEYVRSEEVEIMGLVAIGRLSLVREEETRAECVTPTCNLSARDKRYKCGNGGDERRIVRGKEQRDDKPQTLRPPRCASPFPCLWTRPGISRRPIAAVLVVFHISRTSVLLPHGATRSTCQSRRAAQSHRCASRRPA